MMKHMKDANAAYPIKTFNREDALQKRGAKKGGMTDHLSGIHLIPNVGREAMVPREVVRRQPRKPKAKAEPPKPATKLPLSKVKHRSSHESRPRSRERSKDRRGRSASSSYSASEELDDETRVRLRQEAEKRRKEEEIVKKRADEEQRRKEEEQRKLKELEDIRQKQLDMQSERKQKLGGLFALTEDDIDAEEDEKTRRARIAKERARIEKKALDRGTAPEPTRAGYSTAIAAVGPTSRPSSSSAEMAELSSNGNLTAADLDGSLHDHKFSKVWKDWDSGKKSDPGEIARQFMKIAAIKRRGYAPTRGDPLAGGSGGSTGGGQQRRPVSRSRSRGRRR